MSSGLASLVDCGTRLWLDSVDPDEVQRYRKLGATGATSNPVIVADLIKSGRFDDKLGELLELDPSDEAVAWAMTDHLVCEAQRVFRAQWEQSRADDGYVSFELDPLLEDKAQAPPHAERVRRYIDLGKQWSAEHANRMIKVPATAAGLEALEELAAAGVALNVTLIFSERQYVAARDAIWRGAQRRRSLDTFKSVYSIFISRVDVYTKKHVPSLSPAAQGQVGLVNAKRLWQLNQAFWSQHRTPCRQEIIFASTGAKLPGQAADFYVQALAGSDIQTNPPDTNAAVQESGKTYTRQVDRLPAEHVLAEIDAKVDHQAMEDTLLAEGVAKFADPFKKLLDLIASKRKALSPA